MEVWVPAGDKGLVKKFATNLQEKGRQAAVDRLLDVLNRVHVRVPYSVVGEWLGVPAIDVARRYLSDPCPRESWIVSKTNQLPSQYHESQIHEALLGSDVVKSREELVALLETAEATAAEPEGPAVMDCGIF